MYCFNFEFFRPEELQEFYLVFWCIIWNRVHAAAAAAAAAATGMDKYFRHLYIPAGTKSTVASHPVNCEPEVNNMALQFQSKFFVWNQTLLFDLEIPFNVLHFIELAIDGSVFY